MNDLQKVELELFKILKEICEKLNLNYFLVCGSCLGAARHGGFIPWDDDLDIGMYREDYNKFMELAPSLLPEGIFLQNYKTDPNYPAIFAKLRNSNTTYIETRYSHLNINHGIFIDIFPLDGEPIDSFQKRKLHYFEKNCYRLLNTAFKINPQASLKGKLLYVILRMLGYHKRLSKVNSKLQHIKTKYSAKNSRFIKDLGTEHKCEVIPKEYFGKGMNVLFEGIKVRVPEKCDEYLTSLYGDWRTLPPPEKQKGHHYYEICDTEKPYTYYVNKKYSN